METMRCSSLTNATESGISVSFIQNPQDVVELQTKAMPTSSGSERTPMSPCDLCASVFATYTRRVCRVKRGLPPKVTPAWVGPEGVTRVLDPDVLQAVMATTARARTVTVRTSVGRAGLGSRLIPRA